MSATRSRIIISALIAGSALIGGCKSEPDNVSFDAIRDDPSLAMSSTTETSDDIKRNLAVVNDQNKRMLLDDLGRAFYTDRSSALSPLPVPKVSNQPR